MSSFNKVQSLASGKVARQQYYQDQVVGLNAFQRHKKYIEDYLTYYGQRKREREEESLEPPCKKIKTDFEVMKEYHRFIRSEEDDAENCWQARLAKKYYDRLFKEYCIADLSQYKQAKIGLRWRTHKEVVNGKGQFICGAKGCQEKLHLCSYEVNFAYVEHREEKQALVKLRVCPDCAYKLNYKREREFRKVQKQIMKALGISSEQKVKEKQQSEQQTQQLLQNTEEEHQKLCSYSTDQQTNRNNGELLLNEPQEPGSRSDANKLEQKHSKEEVKNVWMQNEDEQQIAEDEYDKYFAEMFL
eukprot:TRINITY_DN12283_c0_g3_i1.p1 TRINITY_DN12283_c0_g3~~TRINITY_DN12283_c0_g3_i1.p1  ORF type:complete len:301 (+),score=29.98 TRINITY_DN12283_c0_g3_i1:59-961(+)